MKTLKGFTLIEIVVYIALSSFLLTIMFSSFINLMKHSAVLQARTIEIHKKFIYEE